MILAHAAWHDWYAAGTESAVFVGDQVMVLSELATSILTIVGAGDRVGVADIAAALVEQYGDPGVPAEDLAAERVGELLDQGVLTVVD